MQIYLISLEYPVIVIPYLVVKTFIEGLKVPTSDIEIKHSRLTKTNIHILTYGHTSKCKNVIFLSK